MKIKNPSDSLTNRDLDVMNILWNSNPLTASDIVKAEPTLTTNTVQAVLRKLLKNKFIEVAEIVYSGTVLCRSYRPSITAEEFAVSDLAKKFKGLSQDIPPASVVAAFLDLEQDPAKATKEINELEELLKEYKKKLSK